MFAKMDRITFKVNGVPYSVGCEVDSRVTLVDYLRSTVEQRGTKYMCREGGCGACVVAAARCKGAPKLAVNACMVSITSCQNWEITTIEEVGNRRKGYNVLQKTLADQNGTQCGYCTPAWIMNMYCLLQNNTNLTMREIEESFGSNVCRCTGYRPILDAFKKFAKDAPKRDQIVDIEDLNICKKTGLACDKTSCDDDDWCLLDVEDNGVIEIKLKDNKCWYKVCNLKSIFKILDKTGYDSYMLVFGNTAKGAYPIDEYPDVLIDISSVQQLKVVQLDQNMILGAGLTITELLDILKKAALEEYFGYFEKLYEHIKLVAHIPVRNLGSVGGNLMIKHQHRDFGSDIYLLFETVGAYLTIVDAKGATKKLSMSEFLKEDMKGKVILNVLMPPLSDEYKFFSYKVMPRSQNAHAIVNAGFLYKLKSNNTVLEARIVFGGLSPSFSRAENTERFLIGKKLFTNDTLQAALKVLQKEIVVIENPPEPSIKYRKHLALALFYKGVINLCPKDILDSKFLSEGSKIRETRPVSQGTQVYETNPSLWPLNQPIPKVEALIQCAGETKYTDDIPTQPNEVHGAFALSTVASGIIVNIDSSKALEYPGVIAFYSAKDIPGLNSFSPIQPPLQIANEEVFCSGLVEYYNQPIGLVVAETSSIAEAAAKLVTATYKNVQTPVVDVQEATNDSSRNTLINTINVTNRGTDVAKVIKGRNTIYGQYHFMMENISCLTRPSEEGIEVFLTTQWMDGAQVIISKALNIEENRIDVYIRRIGGGFGIKISRSNRSAVACSLVTLKLNRPCRIVVPLTTATRAVGKRLPCHTDFVCEVNSSGVIQYVDYKMYQDSGFKRTENFSLLASDTYYNCYDATRWDFKLYDTKTDTAKNTWCRAPGSLEAISMAENLIERISYELGLDPYDVRMANIDIKYIELKEMAENLRLSASYDTRRASVNEFNSKNRWRKRGLRFSFLRFLCFYYLVREVNLSVFRDDGTIVITHGGIEMGQGLNTKAIQIAAYLLNVPIEYIQVKANSTINSPNCAMDGGSIGNQNVALGVTRCCEILLERLLPVRITMTNPSWMELINKAFSMDVDLQVHAYVGAKDNTAYDIYGVALSEVEVDILTGEFEVRRVDILQDVGQSVSPEIDVGQVEGAFVMGLGYFTSENLVYDRGSGELLSDRTWNYYVPLARDIPQDFRINFRKKSYGFPQFFGAKATGEPSICLSVGITFALREAIAAARQEAGISKTNWFQIDGPFTTEAIALSSASNIEDYKLTQD